MIASNSGRILSQPRAMTELQERSQPLLNFLLGLSAGIFLSPNSLETRSGFLH